MKIYRNIYVKDYSKFPYQKLTGSNTLYYTGKIIYVKSKPDSYDSKEDFYFDCDCEYPEWREIVKVKK